jgi:hypothetical protein
MPVLSLDPWRQLAVAGGVWAAAALSPAGIARLRTQRLAALLSHAGRHSPMYRRLAGGQPLTVSRWPGCR